jgi:hypothetical protein
MAADAARKLALHNWLNALESLRFGVSAFVQACADPKLFYNGPDQADPNSTSPSDISREVVYSEMDKFYPEIDSLHSDLGLASLSVKRLRNLSKTLVTIHSLPNEILSSIFLQGSATEKLEFSEPVDEHGRRFPAFEVVASAVCHLWRDVALNTKYLWSAIDFRRQNNRTLMQLSRSMGVDLGINIAIRNNVIPSGFPPPLDLYARVSDWRHLNMRTQGGDTLTLLNGWVRKIPAPFNLRTLSLVCAISFHRDIELLEQLFETLTQKTSDLQALKVLRMETHCLIPWGRIKNLTTLILQDINRVSVKELDLVLRQNLTLERFELKLDDSFRFMEQYTPLAGKLLHFSKLLALSLLGTDIWSVLIYFFGVVRTSVLQDFECHVPVPHASNFADSIADFLRSSSSTLRMLKLFQMADPYVREGPSYSDTIYRALEVVPSLHSLHITRGNPNGYSKLLLGLMATEPNQIPPLCPRLRILSLLDAVCDPLQFASMTESRVYPLAEVSARLIWRKSEVPAELDSEEIITSIGERIRNACAYVGEWKVRIVRDGKYLNFISLEVLNLIRSKIFRKKIEGGGSHMISTERDHYRAINVQLSVIKEISVLCRI